MMDLKENIGQYAECGGMDDSGEKQKFARAMAEIPSFSNSFCSSYLPKSHGEWEGEPGESVWQPDEEYAPENMRTNPEEKTWEEILDKYESDGVIFKDGFPDFSEFAEETVEIDDFSDCRPDNFSQADQALADKWNEQGKKGGPWTSEDVQEYRKENRLTWHEHQDMKTMQLVPREIHGNVPHSGGVSKKKSSQIA